MRFKKLWLMLALLSVTVGSILFLSPPTVGAKDQMQTCSSQNGLHFRNGTNTRIWVAVNYYNYSVREYVSAGWWSIPPGDTRTVLRGALPDRYYFYYADTDGGSQWRGSNDGWVDFDDSFVIRDSISFSYANSQGYRSPGFRRIDVGNCLGYTGTFRP